METFVERRKSVHVVASPGLTSPKGLSSEDELTPDTQQESPSMAKRMWNLVFNEKAFALIVLAVQNTAVMLCMRKVRMADGPMFIETQAVVMAECMKFVVSTLLEWKRMGYDTIGVILAIHNQLWHRRWDTAHICLVAAIYFIQNVLMYTGATNLDAGTYVMTYQLKIFTTAMFSKPLLGRSFSNQQWSALTMLFVGVVVVKLAGTTDHGQGANTTVGFIEVIVATLCSGFGGVYFEKKLKGNTDVSVWMRNIQLSVCSIPFGLVVMFAKDGTDIMELGFFYGYDWFVWFVIFLNALGGIIVAVVIKTTDNIVKGFACSVAVVMKSLLSCYLLGLNVNGKFVIGAALVVTSVALYQPPRKTSGGGSVATMEDKLPKKNGSVV